MKQNIKKIVLIGALSLLAISVWAAIGFTRISVGGQTFNGSTKTNYAIIPVDSSVAYGTPNITYLNATSDTNAGAVAGIVQFYKTTNFTTSVPAAGFTNTTTVFYVNSTNLFVSGDILVIEHISATNNPDVPNTYEMGVLGGFGARVLTNVITSGGATGTYTNYAYTMTNAVTGTNAIAVGDNIYQMSTVQAGTIPVGVATKELNGSGIFSGQMSKPLLITIIGGTNATINAVSANFVAP